MALTQQQLSRLLVLNTTACPSSIASGMNARANGTLAERFVPLAALLKGNESALKIDIKTHFSFAPEALFGCKVRFSSDTNFEKLQDAASIMGHSIGTRYESATFADFTADIRSIVSQYWSIEDGLDTSKFTGAIESRPVPLKLNQTTSSDCSMDVKRLRQFGGTDFQMFLNNCAYIVEARRRMAASSSKDGVMLLIDEQVMLAALIGVNGFSRACGKSFGIPDFRTKYPESVATFREACMSKVDRRTVSSKNGGSKDFFNFARDTHGHNLELDNSVKQILKSITKKVNEKFEFDLSDLSSLEGISNSENESQAKSQSEHSVFKEFLRINYLESRKSPYSLIKSGMSFLRRNVVGQQLALDSVENHISGLIKNGGKQHLGVSTFFGVSGTGKTHMAESICDVFNQCLDTDFQIVQFNMEQFSNEKDVHRLFGSGVQYTDSALGTLTLAAIKNPRTIFIFDEIEKAHPAVIQSLLTPIDKGFAIDSTSEMDVDLSQSLFIFTTNLGSGSIEHGDNSIVFDPKELFTENSSLANAPFSSEMVNRLAAGNIAIFKSLKARDLLRLASAPIHTDRRIKRLAPPKNQAEIILATLGADASPRTIKTQWSHLEGKIIKELIQILPDDEIPKLDNVRFSSKSILQDASMDTHVTVIGNKSASFSTRAHHTLITDTSIDSIEKALTSDTDAVLLQEESLDANVFELQLLLTNYAEKPIYSFSSKDNPSFLKPFAETGLITEHFEYSGNFNEDIGELLIRVRSQIQLISHTRKMLKRNMKSEYQFAYDIQEDGIEVSIQSLKFKNQVKTEDARLPFLQFAEKPQCNLNDFIGMDKEKAQLKIIVEALQNDNQHNIPLPNGYLLTGRPGTGKTHFARCVAGESEMFFFGVNAADLMIGCPASNINNLFEVASRYSPSIIFIDEIEAIGKDRAVTGFANNSAVNALLTAMDGFYQTDEKIFVLASTNHPDVLDRALKRSGRFDKNIQFHPPCNSGRRECIKSWFNDRGESLSLPHANELVNDTDGMTVADIQSTFDDSVLNAAALELDWKPSMLKEALLASTFGEITEKDKLTKTQLSLLAYHEAGHLVAHRLLLPDVKVKMASIQPRTKSLGAVLYEPSDDMHFCSIKSVKAKIQVLLAGIVAEQLCGIKKGQQNIGSIDDRLKATLLAKDAIENWGMSERYGLAIPSKLGINPAAIEDEVVEWLSDAHAEVTKLLTSNKPILDKVAKKLLEKQVLNEQYIDQLFAPIPSCFSF